MVLSYQLYQQPLDPLGQEIDRFWSVLFTMESSRQSQSMMMMDEDMSSNASKVVSIGGLNAHFTEAHLVKLLMPFGKLEQLQLISHEGYAICSFADPHSAQACVQKLHGRMLLGRGLSVALFTNSRSKRPFGEEAMNCMAMAMEMDSSPIRAIRRKLNEDSYCAF